MDRINRFILDPELFKVAIFPVYLMVNDDSIWYSKLSIYFQYFSQKMQEIIIANIKK